MDLAVVCYRFDLRWDVQKHACVIVCECAGPLHLYRVDGTNRGVRCGRVGLCDFPPTLGCSRTHISVCAHVATGRSRGDVATEFILVSANDRRGDRQTVADTRQASQARPEA